MTAPEVTDSIVDKLGKILNLRDNAGTEGEASAAAEMLQKLLTKYNLEIADLERSGKAEAPKLRETAVNLDARADGTAPTGHERQWTGRWKMDLAAGLAEHFFCHPMIGWRKVSFVGRPDNVESLQMLYGWLVGQIACLTPIERRRYMEETGEFIHAVRWYKAFTAAASRRVIQRLAELRERQVADVDATALVIHHATEISDWLEAAGRRRIDGRQTAREIQADAEWAAQEAAWKKLLEADPEKAYKQRPYMRPKSAKELAEQRKQAEKEDARWQRRQARRDEKTMTWADYERAAQERTARLRGRNSAETINLQPFVAGPAERTALR